MKWKVLVSQWNKKSNGFFSRHCEARSAEAIFSILNNNRMLFCCSYGCIGDCFAHCVRLQWRNGKYLFCIGLYYRLPCFISKLLCFSSSWWTFWI